MSEIKVIMTMEEAEYLLYAIDFYDNSGLSSDWSDGSYIREKLVHAIESDNYKEPTDDITQED